MYPWRHVAGTSFAAHPTSVRKAVDELRPGPGSYDPKYSGGPAITMGGLVDASKRKRPVEPVAGSEKASPSRPDWMTAV